MSERLLSEGDIAVARVAVLAMLQGEQPKAPGRRQLALIGIAEFVVLQILIPILVDVTGTILAEILKGRALSALTRREAKAALDTLKDRPIRPTAEPDANGKAAVAHILTPYGVNEEEIEALYQRIRQKIERG